MQLAVKVVHTTKKIYSQLQTFISTFQSIIVPGALNHIVSEDAHMLQLLEAIKSIRVSSQPGVAVRSVLDTLNHEYHQAVIKVSLYLSSDHVIQPHPSCRELRCLLAARRLLMRLNNNLMTC